jgi:hypothetical protein
MKNTKFDTVQSLAIAIAAFRLLDNKIVRWDGKTPGNKELVVDYFTQNKPFEGSDDTSLIAAAEEIMTALSQKVTMLALTGARPNDFLLKVNEVLEKKNITSRDFGLLVWAPKLFTDIVKQDNDRITIQTAAIGSKYIGRPTEKLELTFTLLTCRYLQNYNMFVHTGHDEHGNLVNFFNKSKIESGRIKARVKTHKQDAYVNNACVTVLNYVKVL